MGNLSPHMLHNFCIIEPTKELFNQQSQQETLK